ncbi:MAG: tRNA-uridine aminocarboxypropyltransferase [Sulfurovum sp.]|nr:tRNA-uridine aminocarboxypropyltransferase [Sulfurovum sp.]
MSKASRSVCYTCYRPSSSCLCSSISAIDTQTQFVLLMHPKEFRKTKNGTGHLTHLSLNNCQLYIGSQFETHPQITALLKHPQNNCFVLYPSDNSINLNQNALPHQKGTKIILFLIDATWACSRAMLKQSPRLDSLPKVSFTHNKNSGFLFKTQPKDYCLSTIESTLCILELLNTHHIEDIPQENLTHFLDPFHKMVAYQVACHTEE